MEPKTDQTHSPAITGQINVSLDDIIPASDIPKRYPHLYTEKSWKWAVLQRKNNGLYRAFRKVGKKLYVNTTVLAECIDQQIET